MTLNLQFGGLPSGGVEFQSQSGDLVNPIGTTTDGRIVLVFNSTLNSIFLFAVVNGSWKFAELTGVVI
jgi:hypothetical protein